MKEEVHLNGDQVINFQFKNFALGEKILILRKDKTKPRNTGIDMSVLRNME